MKVSSRERNLLLGAGAMVVIVALRLGMGTSAPEVAQAVAGTVEIEEKKLARMRNLAATVPGKEVVLKQAMADLTAKEAGLIQADTAQQAQAQLLQVIRALGKLDEIDARGGEFGPVRPLGQDYGEVSVSVAFDCRIEQLVNFLAALTSEKSLLATNDIRITSGNPKEKTLNVRLSVSGVVPRKLVPEQKGSSLF